MRRLLAVGVLALLLAAPARAGAPAVDASAYLVVDARTGEVLAASHAHERLPIASITKLMTVLVTLEHHKLTDALNWKLISWNQSTKAWAPREPHLDCDAAFAATEKEVEADRQSFTPHNRPQ